jgi:D-aminopeptidase
MKSFLIQFCLSFLLSLSLLAQERGRARDFGIEPGILSTGTWNAITDVDGVKVGHKTLIRGEDVRTGVTVILPHEGNLFHEKVPAAVSVGNGFGKAIGFTQVQELGNLETPIALTNTLNVFSVAGSLAEYILSLPGNEEVRSVNPVAGETNDGWLNDIRGRHVSKKDVLEAIADASGGAVKEGNVGAGTGTLCLGFKGGIGTASRILPESRGGYTVGVLVQTNFGGLLRINGAPVGEALDTYYKAAKADQTKGLDKANYQVDGSCMIVVATDAPLSPRNLERLGKRSFLALGRVGSFMSNGSGDYAIAFSTNQDCRIPYHGEEAVRIVSELDNNQLSPLFLAVVEATEEAIYNSLFMAEDMVGQKGRSMKALPLGKSLEVLERHGARSPLAH